MPNKRLILPILSAYLLLLVSALPTASAAELMTLFTTPQERQLINTNRYKSKDAKPVQKAVEEVIESPIQQMIKEEVRREYKISGITVSGDGSRTVWINAIAYEDGEQLEDKSKISVLVGDEIRVRITTPDGKNHYATSGETLEVTYLTAVSN
jgi:predicted secreted protein